MFPLISTFFPFFLKVELFQTDVLKKECKELYKKPCVILLSATIATKIVAKIIIILMYNATTVELKDVRTVKYLINKWTA